MSAFDPVTYQDGDVLFEAGDKADKFYVIKSGKIRIVSFVRGSKRRSG